jgi:hypothetical protein
MTTVAVVDSDVPGTTLIEQTEDDGTVSRSWAHDAIPVQARLNPDAPPASEERTGEPSQHYTWVMPDAECFAFLDGNTDGRAEERRQAFRRAMIEAGRDVGTEIGLIHVDR